MCKVYTCTRQQWYLLIRSNLTLQTCGQMTHMTLHKSVYPFHNTIILYFFVTKYRESNYYDCEFNISCNNGKVPSSDAKSCIFKCNIMDWSWWASIRSSQSTCYISISYKNNFCLLWANFRLCCCKNS